MPATMEKETRVPCRCQCGYRCGGPGRCSLSIRDCLQTNDGNHYVRDCGHDFSGEMEEVGAGIFSCTCVNCGMAAIDHDARRGP